MTFFKIQDVVINTSYIAAIRLDNQTSLGEKSVSVLIAASKFPLLQWDTIYQNMCDYEWIEFTGQAANVFQGYFTSFTNIIDLLPQYKESTV